MRFSWRKMSMKISMTISMYFQAVIGRTGGCGRCRSTDNSCQRRLVRRSPETVETVQIIVPQTLQILPRVFQVINM